MRKSTVLAGLSTLLAANLASASDLKSAKGSACSPSPMPATASDLRPSSPKAGPFESLAEKLPAAPPGVVDLSFGDFFRHPIGPRGLEISTTLGRLDGKRVRMAGYMVRQGVPSPWRFLLCPRPMITHEREYGMADDLPPQTVFVHVDRTTPPIVPYTPGPLLLTGILSVGNREEPDGRVSWVRLHLDPPSADDRRALNASLSHRSAPAKNSPVRAPSSETASPR